jgi:hypothetical protein
MLLQIDFTTDLKRAKKQLKKSAKKTKWNKKKCGVST